MNRRTWLILAALLLSGLLVRISYPEEIKQAPDFASPLADAAFHDYWARSLLSGDWTPPAGMPDPRIQEVPFLRPPGYAYFLAGSYALTGRSYTGVRIVQMVLGLLNCVLAFLLGRALFNRSVGLIMAAFCAVYWALLYFEGELHAPVLLVTLGLLLILTLHRWSRRPSLLLALVAGIILGFMGLLRANDLLFAPVAAVWMVWCLRRQGETSSWGEMLSWREARRWIGPVALFLLGTALTIAPVTIRNAVVADDLFLVSANSANIRYIPLYHYAQAVRRQIHDQLVG